MRYGFVFQTNAMNISASWTYGCHLTQWGRTTHICVSKLTIIISENGLSPGRRQVIIWANNGILLIRTWGTNFSDILNRNSYIFIQDNSFENVVWNMAAICSRPQYVNRIFIVEIDKTFSWQMRLFLYNVCILFTKRQLCAKCSDVKMSTY